MIFLNYAFIALGFLSTSFILFDSAGSESQFDIILLGFWAWAIIPYLILIFANKYFTKMKMAKILVSSAVVITVAGRLLIYYDAFYVHLDAQNGLLFIFLPVYQNMLAIVLSGIAAGLIRSQSS